MRFPGKVSLVLPAHNEEKNISLALDQAGEVLARLAPDYEILVIDDGSTDNTAAIAAHLAGTSDKIRVIRHERNVGYGAALKSGLQASRGDFVFFMDADLQFDVSELTLLLPWIGDFDLVIGYRRRRRDHWGRRLNAWGWKVLIRLLFGLRVKDIDCAFKLLRRRVIDSVSLDSLGAFVNTEILLRARKLGYTLKEVPVTHYPRKRGKATGARPRVIYKAFLELTRLRRELTL